jgi:pyruvate dehydrogenase E1 component beta subunit
MIPSRMHPSFGPTSSSNFKEAFMATQILMPALSPTMEEGKLSKWLKSVGDQIKSGDILAEIETDKATMEVEAVDEGTLSAILVEAGTENVKVNTPIATISAEGESAEASAKPADAKPVAAAVSVPIVEKAPTVLAQPIADAAPEDDYPPGTEFVTQTVREALRDAMAEEMRADEMVFVMGEEVAEYQGAYKITQGLLQEFGDGRVIDTPITEHGFAGLGVGASWGGLKPIVEFMTFNFAMQAMDHIINSAAKTLYMSGGQMGSPVVFRGPNGAAARVGAQHSQDYSAWFSSVPGLKVVMPHTAADYKGLLKSAIRDPNPVVFLENEILYGQSSPVPKGDFTVPIGKAKVARAGSDATVVSFGIGMTYAIKAADELAKLGINVELIDLRTLRPLDMATVIKSVQKTGRCVTVEEGWPQNSVGSEIAARLVSEAFDYLDAPVLKVAGKDVPMPYAANLEKLALPTVQEVIDAVRAVTYR